MKCWGKNPSQSHERQGGKDPTSCILSPAPNLNFLFSIAGRILEKFTNDSWPMDQLASAGAKGT